MTRVFHPFVRCRDCKGIVTIWCDEVDRNGKPIPTRDRVERWVCNTCNTSMTKRLEKGRIIVEDCLPLR